MCEQHGREGRGVGDTVLADGFVSVAAQLSEGEKTGPP